MRRRLLAFTLPAALLLGAAWRGAPREAAPEWIGQLAPAFALTALNAPARTVAPADFAGRPWLLNVWASWCAPCREEHALLLEIAREQGVAIMGLNTRDDPRAADEWLRRLGDPYRTVALDRDGRAAADWGVPGVPATFVVDGAGIVRARHLGPLTREAWQRELLPLWRGLGDPPT